MATGSMTRLLSGLRDAGLAPPGPTDGELLGAFLAGRDEDAFAALVRRHGPMVLGVCRRVLGDVHDAEDAFQATFLVLARQAASIRRREAVGSWLYGAAYRTALQANRVKGRRRAREKQVRDMPQPTTAPDEKWHELQPILDRELNGLPDKYRLPVVLCDLEGRSRRDVARQLRIPEGTLSNRLTAARRMLARRLARHGLSLPAGAVAALLARQATACVPAALAGSTARAAALVAARQTITTVVSTRVTTLTERVVKAMFLSKLKTALAVVLAVGLLGLGGGMLTQPAATGQQGKQGDPAAEPKQAAAAPEQGGAEPKKPGSGTGNSEQGGPDYKKFKQQINDALAALEAAKGQKAEQKAYGELAKAVIDLRDILAEKWGMPKKPKETPPPKITAVKLAEAFLTNQADADERFHHKHVDVTGTIIKVFRAPPGFEHQKGVPDYVVEMLSNEKNPEEVPLQFLVAEAQRQQIMGLKPKQTVTIRAFCQGLVPGMIIPGGTSKKGKSLHFWDVKVLSGEK